GGHAVAPVPRDGGRQRFAGELAALQGDDAPTSRQGDELGHAAGAVHERAGRHAHDPGTVHEISGDLVVDGVLGVSGVASEGHDVADVVVLAPHDALGHSGGTAGVEHVEVVAVTAPRRFHLVGMRGGRVGIGLGPAWTGPAAVVD